MCFLFPVGPPRNRKWIRPCHGERRRAGSLTQVFVFCGLQMAEGTDIRAQGLWRFDQSKNMPLETKSEGKCCFSPTLTVRSVISSNINRVNFNSSCLLFMVLSHFHFSHRSHQETQTDLRPCLLQFAHYVPWIEHYMLFRMPRWCINVCMLLLLLLPCCDCHKIMTQTRTEGQSYCRFSFRILHIKERNSLHSLSSYFNEVILCIRCMSLKC